MDGYAIRCADLSAADMTLQVGQRIPAGSVGQALQARQAARIFTGAPIPAGADAIVMQEDTSLLASENAGPADRVLINHLPSSGQWIRRRGEDLMAGKVA